MATQDFKVALVAPASVEHEQVPITEGVQAWSNDAEGTLHTIPAHLLGGILFRSPKQAFPEGSEIIVEVSGFCDARIYIATEVGRGGKAEGCPNEFASILATTSRWNSEPVAPKCGDGGSQFGMFSTIVQRGKRVTVPAIPDVATGFVLMAVPVFTGSFAVAILSSSGTIQEKLAVMEEGVLAWKDRDHRFLDVPQCLLRGVLHQGPYKDVPDGTMISVRPNLPSRVYVVTERTCSGGLVDSLPVSGWTEEQSAPRWHDLPTMVMFGRNCAAGAALVLPPTRGHGAVLSVIVVPNSKSLVAPVEISHLSPTRSVSTTPAPQIDMVPLSEGVQGWVDGDLRLTKVPEWMHGATLVRSSQAGPPSGTIVGVRAAAQSVIYAIVAEGKAQPLLEAGWERRAEAPEGSPSLALAVYARRVAAREPLALPEFSEERSTFLLVVKVDTDSFSATVETNRGLEFNAVPLVETVTPWIDVPNVYAWIPEHLINSPIFRSTHDKTPSGTVVRITATAACRAYVFFESAYKVDPKAKGRTALSYNGPARTGAFNTTLPAAGWIKEMGSPSWGDTASDMRIFSKRIPEGTELTLPPTVGEVVFSIVVLDASKPQRLQEEMKKSFKMWDPDGLGGILKDDLHAVLTACCPDLDKGTIEAIVADADKKQTGRVDYMELAEALMKPPATFVGPPV